MCAMKRSIMEKGKAVEQEFLNPVTKIILEEDAIFTLDTAQIKGVDSTQRETDVVLGKNAQIICDGEADDPR